MTRRAINQAGQEEDPKPAAPVRMLAPFAFYDDEGVCHSWVTGQLVTDHGDIALLRQRGAMIENEASLQAGPPVGGPRVARFLHLYEEARTRHGHLDGVARLLDVQAGQFRAQITQLQRTIDAASTMQADEVQRAHLLKDKVLDEAETYFASWAPMSDERALLQSSTLRPVPDRPKPLTRRQALQQQYVDAKARHGSVPGVLAILDHRIQAFDHKNRTLDYRLRYNEGVDRKSSAAEQDAAFQDIEAFFAQWLAKSDRDAAKEGKVAEAIALAKRVVPVAGVPEEVEPDVVIVGPSTENTVLDAYTQAMKKHRGDPRVTYLLGVHLAGLRQRLGGYQAVIGRGMASSAVELEQAENAKSLDLLESEKFFTKWLRRSEGLAARQIVLEGVVY